MCRGLFKFVKRRGLKAWRRADGEATEGRRTRKKREEENPEEVKRRRRKGTKAIAAETEG